MPEMVKWIPRNVGDGRFKQWIRILEAVDPAAKDGNGITGPFLTAGRMIEVPVGTKVIRFGMEGSRAHQTPVVHLDTISRDLDGDGALSYDLRFDNLNPGWFLEIREHIVAYCDGPKEEQMPECRSCGAPIIWIVSSTNKRPMPCNAEQTVIVTQKGEVVSGHVSHFATCPQADAHRRKKDEG